MIKIKRNVKSVERRKLGIKRSSKSKERAWAAKFRSKSDPLRKWLLVAKWFRSRPSSSTKWQKNLHALKILHFVAETPFRRVFRSCETTIWHTSATSQRRTPISQLQNGLRKSPSSTKSSPPPAAETISKLQNDYENAPGFKVGC